MRGGTVAISRWTQIIYSRIGKCYKYQFLHLARQVYPEDSDGLFMVYLDETERPHCYLLFDLSQDTDDPLMFRTYTILSQKPPT